MGKNLQNNEKFRLLLKIVFWLTPVLAGVALAFGGYREKMFNMSSRLEAVEKKTYENNMALNSMITDIEYIKQALGRIERKIDEK